MNNEDPHTDPSVEPDLSHKVRIDPASVAGRSELFSGCSQVKEGSRNESSRSSAHSEVDTDSVFELLNVLTEEDSRVPPELLASTVFSAETQRRRAVSLITKSIAFAGTLMIVIFGWFLANDIDGPAKYDERQALRLIPFYNLMGLDIDDAIVEAVFDFDKPMPSDVFARTDARDTRVMMSTLGSTTESKEAEAILSQFYDRFLAFPEPTKKLWLDISGRIQSLSVENRTAVFERFDGLLQWHESLTDLERRNFERLKGDQKLGFVNRKAEFLIRQFDAQRKQAFSIADLNRPDYLMDLATLTVAWMKLTPLQKNAVERRSRNSMTDPLRKVDRIRQLAQILEGTNSDGPGSNQILQRSGPFQRAIAKGEMAKQDREKRRVAFQKIVGASSGRFGPTELESFLESLPPWLMEAVDPLPPSEAKRFLSLLKLLVDHQASDAGRPKNGN